MKSLFTTLALTLSTVSAHADIITCHFTEPFITTQYSMVKQSLSVTGDIANKTDVIHNVSFQIKGPGEFELVGQDGKVIQILKLTNNGSDGMSDLIYPYEVVFNAISNSANNGVGGCESIHLHSTGNP